MPQSPLPAHLPPLVHCRPAGRLPVGPPSTASSLLSTPPSAGLPAPNFQWFAKQMDVLFAIACQKAELELQAATVYAHHEEEESLARIAAIRAPTSVVTAAVPTWTVGEDKEASIDEISLVIFSIAGRYSGLPKAEIAQIYENCFKTENLHKFCHLKGHEDKG